MENSADIIITVLNESRNIKELLESLLSQTFPCHIIVVDGGSTDGTQKIVRSFFDRGVTLYSQKCGRGEGRNIGVRISKADFVLFTDGDAVPDKSWAECMVKNLKDHDLVCGKTITRGKKSIASLDRVKIFYKGFEVTLPSMNMGLRREAFLKCGGFDPELITAEDIDLNIRAVSMGLRAYECQDCIVFHNARESFRGFIRQAFWNGYGRYQLKRKNKRIWNDLDRDYFHIESISLMWLLRYFAGFLGYVESMLNYRFRKHPESEVR